MACKQPSELALSDAHQNELEFHVDSTRLVTPTKHCKTHIWQ